MKLTKDEIKLLLHLIDETEINHKNDFNNKEFIEFCMQVKEKLLKHVNKSIDKL
jgi:hypothetical protein